MPHVVVAILGWKSKAFEAWNAPKSIKNKNLWKMKVCKKLRKMSKIYQIGEMQVKLGLHKNYEIGENEAQ